MEALTFADQVVVMTRGRAVQIGSAPELFERPQHTFVGHFIGSPGMNFLPVRAAGGTLHVAGTELSLAAGRTLDDGDYKLGVRPEYVALARPGDPGALPVTVTQVQDLGTHLLVSAAAGGHALKARVAPDLAAPAPGEEAWLQVLGAHTCFYRDEELVA